MLQDLLAVFGRTVLLGERDDPLDLVVRDKAALDALGLALAQGGIQHIALADELFRAGLVQNDARLDLRGDRKRNAGGDIGLHDARDDIRGWALGGDDEVHAGRARLLRDAADRGLDLLGRDHHEVGQLVDDDDDLGQDLVGFGRAALGLGGLGLLLAHEGVIVLQLAHLAVRKQLVAPLHLAHRPVERTRRLLGIGHDRDEQMGDAVVVAELDHFGVHHNQAHFLGRGFIEERDQHGVDAHRFARAGRAGDEQMGHLGDIAHDGRARDILANRKGHARLGLVKGLGAQDLADMDDGDRLVWHLNADGDLVRDGRDADRHRAERQRNVVRQGGDAAELDAALDGQLKPRDRRAAHDADDLGLDAEGLQRVDQALAVLGQLGLHVALGAALGLVEQVDGRILVDRDGRLLVLVHLGRQLGLFALGRLLALGLLVRVGRRLLPGRRAVLVRAAV